MSFLFYIRKEYWKFSITEEDVIITLKSLLDTSSMKDRVINIISHHATIAITINEYES